jgi:hypothetical protein
VTAGARSNGAIAIALIALVAAVGGGTAVAVNGGLKSAAKVKPPKVHKVKANPEGGQDPCGQGKTGIFCGADSISGPRIWANLGQGYAPATYSKDSLGRVTLDGTVVNVGPPATAEGMFRLPGSYRPDDELVFATACGLNSDDGDPEGSCLIQVLPDGYVDFVTGQPYSGHSLDGITFQAP